MTRWDTPHKGCVWACRVLFFKVIRTNFGVDVTCVKVVSGIRGCPGEGAEEAILGEVPVVFSRRVHFFVNIFRLTPASKHVFFGFEHVLCSHGRWVCAGKHSQMGKSCFTMTAWSSSMWPQILWIIGKITLDSHLHYKSNVKQKRRRLLDSHMHNENNVFNFLVCSLSVCVCDCVCVCCVVV